jgi:hypothetical protein
MRFGVFAAVHYSLKRVSCQVQTLGIETPCIFVRAAVNHETDMPACRACSNGTSADADRNVNRSFFLKFLGVFSELL